MGGRITGKSRTFSIHGTYNDFFILKYYQSWKEIVFCFENCSDLLWEKTCSSDWDLRSVEQFVRTAIFETEHFFDYLLEVSIRAYVETIKMQTGM